MKHLQFFTATLIIVLGLATAQQANAAVFSVSNTNDSGTGSLRQAILQANNNNDNDTITFDSSVFNQPKTIVLTSGELSIEPDNSSGTVKTLTIFGTGANLLTISGNNQSRIFHLERYADAVFNNLKMTAGNGMGSLFNNFGGAILAEGGASLRLTNSILSGNNVSGGGGAIYSGAADVKIINSLIADNKAGYNGGGGIYQGSSSLNIYNSTISGNTDFTGGAGIRIVGAIVSLTNCTVAFNTSIGEGALGGGIYVDNQPIFGFSDLSVRNSIIAKNISGSNQLPDIFANSFRSLGHNIYGSSLYIYQDTTSQLNIDPQLDPTLRNNGGIIPTHALSAGSPAIDSGDNCVLTISPVGCINPNITEDQRGVSRPQDGNNDGMATVDIGAFEVTPAEIAFSPKVPDLQSANDTGANDSDNITSNRSLSFDVSGVSSGATVEFYRDGLKIAETVAVGNNVVFNDANVPANGVFIYSARQIVNNAVSIYSSNLSVVVDTSAPTVSINQANGQVDSTRIQPINFTVVFNEDVTGFDAADVSLSGSTANVSAASVVVTGSGKTYNVAVSNITGDGSVIANILPNAAKDVAGNASVASTSIDNSVIFDTTAPTVTINQATSQTDATRNLPVNFTVVFNEPVTGFNAADISLSGSTANVLTASITVTGSGTTYNVSVSNFNSNGDTVRASVVAQAAMDAAGNQSVISTSSDNVVTVDNVFPTVTINQAAGQTDPTNSSTVNFTVVFSEAVTGFDASDVSLTNSSVSTSTAIVTVTGSGTTYNVAVSNFNSNGGFIRPTVRIGAAVDALGNSSLSSTSTDNTITVDNVAPTVSINQSIGQTDPASNQPINFTVIFSESVSDFDASDVSLAGSTANVSSANVTITGTGNVYNVRISNITSGGQVRAVIATGAARDATGNLSGASSSTDNTVTVVIRNAVADFDGDGKSDVSVYRPSNGVWYLLNSNSGFSAVQFGISTDKIAPADFDGDGKTDVAVWRDGTWYLQKSRDGFASVSFGSPGDIPAPSDFTGDGRADLAVFRPSNGTWYVLNLVNNQFSAVQFGIAEDKPVVADYDGDGKSDYAVYRPSTGVWYLLQSTKGFTAIQFGISTDKPVVGDYDGDGKADQAVYRAESGTWYLLKSTQGFSSIQFGLSTDIPAAGDFDGDGKTDIAVFRPESGNWYQMKSTQGFGAVQFGSNGDKPTPNAFAP